jgi:hypothetical protein
MASTKYRHACFAFVFVSWEEDIPIANNFSRAEKRIDKDNGLSLSFSHLPKTPESPLEKTPNKTKILCSNALDTQVPFFVYSTHPKASSYQYFYQYNGKETLFIHNYPLL